VTHQRALDLAGVLIAAGFRVDVGLAPARPPADVRQAGAPATADVSIPIYVPGARFGLDDFLRLDRVLASQDARADFDPHGDPCIRIFDGRDS
jgi:hypothetical protein